MSLRSFRQKSARRRRIPKILFRTAAVFLLCFLIFALYDYPWTLTVLGRFLALSQQPERSDLILVLGGDFWGPRPVLGADLGVRGFAPRVLISGPPYNGKPESDLSVQFLVEKGYPRDLFLSFPLRFGEASTIDEAIAVCPELRRLGAKKVLLVTSEYHSRRANLVFQLFCPGIQYRSAPSKDDQFEVEKWWKTELYRKVFLAEWQKILGTVFWKYPQFKLGLIRAHK